MSLMQTSCEEFVRILASDTPVPGGGGAAALAGALGTALGHMVGSLTVGKKKYADVQEDILRMNEQTDRVAKELLALAQQDADAFWPLSQAYGLPKDTTEQREEKQRVMEQALKGASKVPLEIMQKCAEAIELIEQYANKGTAIAISDAGAGAALCRGALAAASLNIFTNTRSMTDRSYAGELNRAAQELLDRYVPMADGIFDAVRERFF